jgi:GNAT superfamily N-acetyltransferase
MNLNNPVLLTQDHQVNSFSCSESVLDDWLKRRPLSNNISGASRTFVVADDDFQVMGYYALAAGAVAHQEATRSIRQNMPDPIPVMVLARLAVDVRAQGMKLGAALLRDAVERCVLVSQNFGIQCGTITSHDVDDADTSLMRSI